ncbi:hypothetical protein E2C01_080052 [Portunus trituberculatus]|uniref:Uncharacterized protein n=1 Tax=Portunus trituberculatus TaxID=210409 RepID=A0A5B7IS47_PORTR|nr:hypothetical protein [Portunus trituberculatus]
MTYLPSLPRCLAGSQKSVKTKAVKATLRAATQTCTHRENKELKVCCNNTSLHLLASGLKLPT